ncbi:polysaccharide deacetylase family protein [Akkermansiaceae bacterium]|nr:polysaccharide deacetylase family protein [Akkermansiaceae bacterium]
MGQFIISLDFEKFWGACDHVKLEDYRLKLERVDKICLEMLELFSEYDIHATWATVGLLAFDNKNDLLTMLSTNKSSYERIKLSPYEYIFGNDLEKDLHFAPNIIKKIRQAKNQELASHTFSHFYCLEPGQNLESFDLDLKMNIRVMKEKFGVDLCSLVFPRNQIKKEYLNILTANGIKCYRGNERNWIYQEGMIFFLKRGFRLIDSYLNITGSNTYKLKDIQKGVPYNMPSSCFLRPVRSKDSLLKRLKMKRIKSQMTFAARNDKVFHIWWHPHNFGNDITANIFFLREILEYFVFLKNEYGMCSLNMNELCKRIEE